MKPTRILSADRAISPAESGRETAFCNLEIAADIFLREKWGGRKANPSQKMLPAVLQGLLCQGLL